MVSTREVFFSLVQESGIAVMRELFADEAERVVGGRPDIPANISRCQALDGITIFFFVNALDLNENLQTTQSAGLRQPQRRRPATHNVTVSF